MNDNTRPFRAPGPGSWMLERTHLSTPLSRFSAQSFCSGLARGFKEGCDRYGIPVSHIEAETVNGFVYVRQVPLGGSGSESLPPRWIFSLLVNFHPAFRKRVKISDAAFKNKLWRDDLLEWDLMKPDSIARNQRLQSVDLASLSDVELVSHLNACQSNCNEMCYRHHKYTLSSTLPVGYFIHVATEKNNLTVKQALNLLRGSTPISLGTAREQLSALVAILKEDGLTIEELESSPTDRLLDSLRQRSDAVAAALTAYLDIVGHMLVGGYCVTERTMRESHPLIVAQIRKGLAEDSIDTNVGSAEQAAMLDGMLDGIEDGNKQEFEEALVEARHINRLRDERGIYNDIWSAGIARHAILEAGRRLRGVLPDAELLLDADLEEITGLLERRSTISVDELLSRRRWRQTQSMDSIPQTLGPVPSDPPPASWMPKGLQPIYSAILASMLNVVDDEEVIPDEVRITGIAVNNGLYEGIARVVANSGEFNRIQPGDVLVTKNTSAAFNAVLPLLGALVTDRGGALSHAAIMAREYGIPAIVSTRVATQRIPDGARIRVDGISGEVTIL